MIYRFPHEAAYLPRTRLSYINLPGILSDGKRERAARVSGYVAIQLGERCYLIFLRNGEAFNAARIDPGSRGPVALSEVLRIVGTESERGENGQIGYFGAGEDQLQAMLATVVSPQVLWEEPLDPAKPDHFFPRLREKRFSGVLELSDGTGKHHYLCFQAGGFQCGWFSEREPSVAVPDFLRSLFHADARGMHASLYTALTELPVQAGPGFVDLYRRIVGGVMRDVANSIGREAAIGLMRRGQAVAALQHPVAAAFDLTDEGRVSGDPVASPEVLTESVAAWLTEALISASDHYGIDPGAVVERAARDSRFVLQEHGFFSRLPWALAL
ncbi:MAG TPA: hypothetical protein VFH27_14420 [Longimicrobiaceae bacterium]|nr:hypothetical protein [Longimicrobiaceae bacterium]